MNSLNYILNKSISLAITVGIIVFLMMIADHQQVFWRYLMLGIIFFGQGHFLVSYYYSYTSKTKIISSANARAVGVYLLLGTSLLLFLFFWYGNPAYLLFVLAGHFLMHNMLNERTMLARYTGFQVSYLYAWAVIFWTGALYATAVLGSSFSFYYFQKILYVDVLSELTETAVLLMDKSLLLLVLVTVAGILSLASLFRENFLKRRIYMVTYGIFSLLIMGVLFFNITFSFIVMLSFIIIYHYITWLLFSWHGARSIESKRKIYISNGISYGFLFIVFLFGNIFAHSGIKILYWLLFSGQMFMLWTFIHINFTLINEIPIRKFFQKL